MEQEYTLAWKSILNDRTAYIILIYPSFSSFRNTTAVDRMMSSTGTPRGNMSTPKGTMNKTLPKQTSILRAMWEPQRGSKAADSSAVIDKSDYSDIDGPDIDDESHNSLGSSRSRPSLFSLQQKQQSTASLLGTKESRAISVLKFAVFFVIFLAVCAVAAATYLNITGEEKDNFEEAVGFNR